jgi:hypothetical protein
MRPLGHLGWACIGSDKDENVIVSDQNTSKVGSRSSLQEDFQVVDDNCQIGQFFETVQVELL